jgi:hypothetical protein
VWLVALKHLRFPGGRVAAVVDVISAAVALRRYRRMRE